MSALATAPPNPPTLDSRAGALGYVPGSASERLFEPGGATLEDRISAAWDDLAVDGRTECPVCAQTMVFTDGCSGCGSELS